MMRIFLTGATGFIGSRIVPELLAAGHDVLGLTRSEWRSLLVAAGAQAHRGTLEDLDSIRAGAVNADAVIHTAFDHDFSNFVANCEKDRRVIAALGAVLKGSERPLLITSGTGIGDPGDGTPAVEDVLNLHHPNPRIASEMAGQALLEDGVNVAVMRLPQVHDTVKQGLITPYIQIAREKGSVAYVGDGGNRWPAAHVLDVAKLYALAIERAQAARGTMRWLRKAYPPVRLRKSWVSASACRSYHWLRRMRRSTSDGLPCSLASTCLRRAGRRVNCWIGILSVPTCLPIWRRWITPRFRPDEFGGG
ncbi:NAD-dependent epimerase/dehydratase family protein [Novosphingobium resinovorum]